LPPELLQQFENAYAVLLAEKNAYALDRRDDGSPLGATAPGDLAEEGTE